MTNTRRRSRSDRIGGVFCRRLVFLVRLSAAIVLFSALGCVTPATLIHVQRDPTTGAVEAKLERSWMAGPVDIEGDFTLPDGTLAKFHWTSEIDLSAARAEQDARLAAFLQAMQAALSAAPAPTPGP